MRHGLKRSSSGVRRVTTRTGGVEPAAGLPHAPRTLDHRTGTKSAHDTRFGLSTSLTPPRRYDKLGPR